MTQGGTAPADGVTWAGPTARGAGARAGGTTDRAARGCTDEQADERSGTVRA
ncbi:hypothetical protein Q760_09550 [Cellulomonas cellasea DSM 20118]|uniref:Uncharacterized protein n=1 Tax=Cellulomonas cellasea DSM 20118 TaxID=1408250 RepID=A0A0A0BAF3_9CELL|nr:hypothetical protein Q760_09550 [Cellulomonas cellasea DSM 20118]